MVVGLTLIHFRRFRDRSLLAVLLSVTLWRHWSKEDRHYNNIPKSPLHYICDMSSIVINPKNTEDLGLAHLMKKADISEIASEEEIFEKLTG